MYRTLNQQAFRRLSKNPVKLNVDKVDRLLVQEWNRFKNSTNTSSVEYHRSKDTLPLGVVSNFQHWDPHPIAIASAKGAWMKDVDGREMLDLSMGFGAMLAGHLNPVVVEEAKQALETGMLFVTPSPISRDAAERISKRFDLDLVRFANSGTEATMYAARTAKAYTGKKGILKVEGGYHGGHDSMLVSAKPGLHEAGPAHAPVPVPATGTTPGDMFIIPFNDLPALEKMFQDHAKDIACYIVEPVLENLAIVLPDEGYFQRVRELCDAYNVVLIFDEVKTGLTAGLHGAAPRLGVKPDLITLAKSIGGGMPVAAFGGKRHIMDTVVTNTMSHFGTFNGNPLCMAGIRAMDRIATADSLGHAESLNYQALERIGEIIDEYQLPAHTVGFGVKGCVTWSSLPVRNYRDYKATDFKVAELMWLWSLNRDIITPPGLDEQWLISLAHEQREVDILVEDFRSFAAAVRA